MVREIKQDRRQNPDPSVNGQRRLLQGSSISPWPHDYCSMLFPASYSPFYSKFVLIKSPHTYPALNILLAHPGRHSLFHAWHCLSLSTFMFSVLSLRPELFGVTNFSPIEL